MDVAEKIAIIKSTKKSRVKWGFIWALLCAVMWGIGYVPLATIWEIEPLAVGYGFEDPDAGYLVGSYLDAFVQAMMFGIILTVLWAGTTGKLGEYKRVATNRKILKWLFLGALCGGPMAIFGTALATGYIGAQFAAAVSLLSCVVGALVGRLFNHEKFSIKAIIGLVVIVIGGVIIFDPVTIINDIMHPASEGNVLIGYIGALMSVLGWGFEGNLSIRALNITDADASLPVRFSIEFVFWLIIMLPLFGCIVGFDTFVSCMAQTFTSVPFLFWMMMAALSLGFCYAAQYKAFPLIGVGRTLCLCNMYVPVSMIALFIFLGVPLNALLIIGSIIAILGTFIMYWDKGVDEVKLGGESDA